MHSFSHTPLKFLVVAFVVAFGPVGGTSAQSIDAIAVSRGEEARRGLEEALARGPVRGRFLERFPGNYVFSPENRTLPAAPVVNPGMIGALAVGPLIDVSGKPASGGLLVERYALAAQVLAPSHQLTVTTAGAPSPVSQAFAAANSIVDRLRVATAPGAMSVEKRAVEPDNSVGGDVLKGIRDYTRAYRAALDRGDKAAVEAIVKRWIEVRATVKDVLPDGTEFKAIYKYPELYAPWRYDRIHRDAGAVVALVDSSDRPFCSGAVIADNLVLTAGHCFSGPPRRDPGEVKVWFDFVESSDGVLKTRTVREIAATPVAPPIDRWADVLEGRFSGTLYDYAIVELKLPPVSGEAQPSILPKGVKPLCLRSASLARKEAVYVIGFPQAKPATVHDSGRVEFPYRVAKGPDFDLLRIQVDADHLARADYAGVMSEFDRSYILDPDSGQAAPYYYFRDARAAGQPRMGISVDTFKGNSGGPVFDHLGKQCIVGVLNGGMPDTPASLEPNWRAHERVLPVRAIVDDLKKHPSTTSILSKLSIDQ